MASSERPVRDCQHHRVRHEHGTDNAYLQDRCRCGPCSDAHHVKSAYWYRQGILNRHGRPPRTVDGTGTARRIEALAAAGWSMNAVAAHAGISPHFVRHALRAARRGNVTVATARAVAAIYDELSVRALPVTPRANSVRLRAAAKGWAVPMRWDDDAIDHPVGRPADLSGWRDDQDRAHEVDPVAVERTLEGDPPTHPLTPAEKRVATRLLTEAGLSSSEIAACLGCRQRSVVRYRSEGAMRHVQEVR